MTESEWDVCTDPQKMLAFLRDSGRASERKLRLFAVACCRRIWHLLTDDRSRGAVQVAEQFADGLAAENERVSEWRASHVVVDDKLSIVVDWEEGRWVVDAARAPAEACVGAELAWQPNAGWMATAAYAALAARDPGEGKTQCHVLRDIFGPLLFRLAPSFGFPVLAWNGGMVGRLAQAADEERLLPAGALDPARLGVLADALEEAGLTDTMLLEHLRSPGPHVRGCFALDAVMGRF
jgi:hypothetical protein